MKKIKLPPSPQIFFSSLFIFMVVISIHRKYMQIAYLTAIKYIDL